MIEKRESLREKYNLHNTFVFGFIGTFGHWHGIEVLEYIIPIICDSNPTARFLLIGEGLLKPHAQEILKKYTQENKVIFTGKIPQDSAPEYLAACNAFLCPTQPNADGSRFFGSPTKLFEYMSMGKPIIASDLEQLSEVISPAIKLTNESITTITDEVGILVEPLAWNEWAKACLACINLNKEDQDLLGYNARQKVLKHYTWDKHVEKIISHINIQSARNEKQ